jgi:SAM-dependent methyltransferase
MARGAAHIRSTAPERVEDRPGLRMDLATEVGACALCGERRGQRLGSGPDFEYDTTGAEFTLWRCPCGGAYLDPRPAPSALARIYPDHYYAYDFVGKAGGFVMRFKGLAERAKLDAYRRFLPERARVLDIGCGDGHLLVQLAGERRSSLRLEGVEFQETAARAAEARGLTVYRGRIEDVELPAASFDLIIMNQLIEHVADPVAVLAGVGRALRAGGHVFVETPNLDSLDARLFRRRYWGGYHLPRHFHLFDTRTLPALARRAGLTPIEVRPLVCPQFWILSLHNWLCDLGARRFAHRWLSPFNPVLLAPFTLAELVHRRVWWTSNLQMIAQRAC